MSSFTLGGIMDGPDIKTFNPVVKAFSPALKANNPLLTQKPGGIYNNAGI